MKLKLYETNNANNVINKILYNEKEYDVKLKGTTDMINPVIVLQSSDIILSNYAYIEKFNRYYFVKSIELFPNSIYHISLQCDVLESFKNDILVCNGYITQQNNNVNKYYDSGYKNELRKEVDIIKSDVTLPETKTLIMTTIGG